MPETFYKNLKNKTKLIVWQASEDYNFFKQKTKLTSFEKKYINKIKTQKRKIEYICVRFILQNILNCNKPVLYDNNGKPFIDNKTKLSISHSNNFIAVFLSDKNIGIDIEKISDKPYRVKEKFLSISEMQLIDNEVDVDRFYTLFWSVKETIFKQYSNKHLAFKENIKIQDFNSEIINVNVITNQLNEKQKVFYKKITNFVITWAEN